MFYSSSFNGGETGDIVAARPENERRKAGCKKLKDMVCIAQGPATRRPGFLYMGEADVQTFGDDDNVRIRPFIFSVTESRELEFSHNKIRIWKDDALVPDPDTPENPYEIETTYSGSEVPWLWLRQIADIVYIATPYTAPHKLTRTDDDDWTLEEIDFLPATTTPTGVEIVNTEGVASPGKRNYSYVITAIDDTTGEESLPSEEEEIQGVSSLNSVDGNYNTISWYNIHPHALQYKVYKYDSGLFGFIGTVPGDDFIYIDLVPGSGWSGPGEYEKVITALIDEAAPEGVRVDTGSGWYELTEGTIASLGATEYGFDSPTGKMYMNTTIGNPNTFTGLEYSNHGLEFVDDNILADAEDSPPGDQNPFVGEGNYPAIAFSWEQRIGWASTLNNLFDIHLSPSALFESLAASTPPVDSDAIEATLAAEMANKIQSVEGDRMLMVLTTGNEWSMGKVGEPLTPASVGFDKQGGNGSEAIPPLVTGSTLLYVQRGGDVIRELIYSFSGDRYEAPDISILASHLLDGRKIKAWCWQNKPYSIVWLVLEPVVGKTNLVGMTYIREHEVVGWHQHDVGGIVEDICCVPGVGYDRVHIVVKRSVNGSDKRYIERMENYFIRQSDKTDCFFVDSGVKFDNGGTPTKILTDIAPHLIGETVNIWADGVEQAPQIVGESGTVVLVTAADKGCLGLPMISDLVPNRPELSSPDDTTLTRTYKVHTAKLKLYKSALMEIGVDYGEDGDLEEVMVHDTVDALVPPYVEMGDSEPIAIDSGWEEDWNLTIRAPGAGPMTILAAVYDLEIGDTL